MDCARDAYRSHGESGSSAAKVFTPLPEAVAEIRRRHQDAHLMARVEDFLQGDIPDYLRGFQPVLYLARHIATPNLETLRFAELARPFGLPMVVGQDMHDKFVSHNAMKRALGKLPVQRKGEQLEYVTIVDFAAAQGARLCDVRTRNGQRLPDFHAGLMGAAALDDLQVADDAEWIDRQQRGNLLEHYKRFLALFVAHGVMLETYVDEDESLLRDVIRPGLDFVLGEFGAPPLIADIAESAALTICDGNAYPHAMGAPIRRLLHGS